MRNLAINLETFGFIERERLSDGKIKIFRCGRDFLYYAFNYYFFLVYCFYFYLKEN